MTVSIFQTLATLPSGAPGDPLTPDELSRYLRNNYDTDTEKDRNRRHTLRDELYHDGGDAYIVSFIDRVFSDPTVRELRKRWVPYAKFNNAIKRIVNEQSTVYSEPAKRIVGAVEADPDALDAVDDPAVVEPPSDNERLQDLLEAVRMDERMVEVDRLLSLHRALLVGFRVRVKPDGTREPTIDIATPANVRAIMHPNDDTLVIGWLIRTSYKTARKQINDPKWTLWTDHESIQLRDDLSVIGESIQEHGLGVCPWVPVTLSPTGPGFWPGYEGEDLVAAHIAIWFNNILLLKESKSATKQTVITGDGTSVARSQAADTEVPAELSDGQSASTVDMSMDLSMFRDTTDHVLYNTSYNYGMSPAIMTHQGVQSAEARELMRLPLREIRRQRQVPLRRFEAAFVVVMAAVCREDLEERAFDPSGFRIEFAESETPLDPISELTRFERERAAGLTNTIEFMQKKRPGLTAADAFALMNANVMVELERNHIMRPLQAIQGTMNAAIEGAAAGAKIDAMQPITEGGAPVSGGSKPGGGAPPSAPPP